MVWTLAFLALDAVIAALALRGNDRRRHRVLVGSMTVGGIGCALLVATVVTRSLGLFYLALLVLGPSVPLSLFLGGAMYWDQPRDPLGGTLPPLPKQRHDRGRWRRERR